MQGALSQSGEDDPNYIAHYAGFQGEMGHHVKVSPPLPPDHQLLQGDDEWSMDVSHPNTTHAASGQRVTHHVNLGTDAGQVPSRIREFMVGRHGLQAMQQLMNGTYGQGETA